MKKIIIWAILLAFPWVTFANTYIEKKVWDYTFKVIQYDLSSEDYEIKVVKTDDATNLWNLLEENNAITWVNWVFFCPIDYDWCNTNKSFTDNERYIEWTKYAAFLTTWDRAVFGWTKDKKPFIYQSGKINMDNEDQIYYWLWNYPLLLSEWQNMLEYYWDAWLIDNKMRVKSTRNFICSDLDKKNIYFWLVYNATMDELAWALSDFWCYDALNLDAGLSTTFMYNWRYIVWPQKRDILDAVAIERKWLNVKEVSKVAEKIWEILIKDSKKKARNNKEKAIMNIDKYINALEDLRKKVYEKYSTDILEQNIVWETDKVWYKIEINDLKALKLIYVINKTQEILKKAKKDLGE